MQEKFVDELEKQMGGEHEIGGRRFRVARNPTFEQDLMISSILMDLGLDDLDPKDAIAKGGKQLKSEVKNVIVRAYESGRLFELTAAVLEEVGTEWARECVLPNSEFFRTLRDREDKQKLNALQSSMLVGFWLGALASSVTSTSSSQMESQQGARLELS